MSIQWYPGKLDGGKQTTPMGTASVRSRDKIAPITPAQPSAHAPKAHLIAANKSTRVSWLLDTSGVRLPGYSDVRINEILTSRDRESQQKFLMAVINFLGSQKTLPAQIKTGVSIIDAQHTNLFFYVPQTLTALSRWQLGTFMKFTEFLTFYFCMHYSAELELQQVFQTHRISTHTEHHKLLTDGWMRLYRELHAVYKKGELRSFTTREKVAELQTLILDYAFQVLKHILTDDIPHFGKKLQSQIGDVNAFVMARVAERKEKISTGTTSLPQRLLHPYNLRPGDFKQAVGLDPWILLPEWQEPDRALFARNLGIGRPTPAQNTTPKKTV